MARGAGAGLVGRVVRNGAQLLFAVLAARWLGAESFGLWLLAFGVTTIAAQAAKLGLDRGAVAVVARRRSRGDAAGVRAAVGATLRLGSAAGLLVATVLLLLAAPIASRVLDQPDVLPYMRVMLIALPFQVVLLVASGASRGFGTMRTTVVAEESVQPLVLLAAFAGFMLAGYPPVSSAWAQSLSMLAAALVALVMLLRMLPARSPGAGDAPPPAWRALFATSLPLALVAISGRLYAWLSTLILGAWARAESVAIFQASLRITFLLLFVTMPINQMLAPVLAERHAAGDDDDVARLLRGTTRWILVAGLPLVLSFVLFGADWLQIFGDEFRRGRPILAALAVSTLINAWAGPSLWLLQMARRERSALGISLLFVAAQAGFALALTPSLGGFGAALATLASVVVSAAAAAATCRRSLGVSPFDRTAVRPVVAAAVAGAVGLVVAVSLPAATGVWSAPRLAAGSALVGGVYLAVLARLGFEADDLAVLDRVPLPGLARAIRKLAGQPVG